MSWYTNSKLWSFVGGIAVSAIGTALSKNSMVRKGAVNAVAQGMLLKEGVQENLQSIKDDAEDLAAEARIQAKIEAEKEAEAQATEARIREMVQAEMKAQQACVEEINVEDISD